MKDVNIKHGKPINQSFLTLLVTLAVCVASTQAHGLLIKRKVTYDITHRFTLNPGGNVAPQVNGLFFEDAWVRDPTLRLGGPNPVAQPLGFAQGGLSFMDRFGRIVHRTRANQLNGFATTGTLVIPGGGIMGAAGLMTSMVNPPVNSAEGNSRFTVNPFGAGGIVSGKMQVDGFAEAARDNVTGQPFPSEAYAFSSVQVTARGGRALGQGNINWGPIVRTRPLAGSAFATTVRRVSDPIFFEAVDATTDEIISSGVLLDITANVFGDGAMEWDSSTGIFDVDAFDLDFLIDLTSSFTIQQGLLDLVIRDGTITRSNDMGIFDGLLPPVGSLGNFSFLLGPIEFDYDLGPLPEVDVEVAISFAGAGSAFASVPEPTMLTLLGLGLVALAFVRRRTASSSSTPLVEDVETPI